jgi:hypothetical protein
MSLPPWRSAAAVIVITVGLAVPAMMAQRPDAYHQSRDHPAIAYSTRAETTAVVALNGRLENGQAKLSFDDRSGYLRSVLQAFDIMPESQVLVFAQNSSQGALINPRNPRAVFFNDSMAVGFVRGGTVLEIAAQDPAEGVIFYTLDQRPAGTPQFKRNNDCLACHLTWDTLGVPGFFVLSAYPLPEDKNAYATGFVSDHRLPFEQRWGGWYVTGRPGAAHHMGNVFSVKGDGPSGIGPDGLASLDGQFDLNAYPAHTSDVAALMVLEHQAHMTNLLTRVGWEARLASFEGPTPEPPIRSPSSDSRGIARVREAARDLVDYLLFVDEVPLARKVQPSSGFAAAFSTRGPKDGKGRSLHQLDLEHRLLRYPCSYMIYSEAFDALPVGAKDLVYQRLWQVLSGQERERPYTALALTDRQAIVEILRATKKDLPGYFQTVSR